jgi:hypothetical protein
MTEKLIGQCARCGGSLAECFKGCRLDGFEEVTGPIPDFEMSHTLPIALKPRPNQQVIKALELLLESAREGKIQAVLALTDLGPDGLASDYAGELTFGYMLQAFEMWKHEWITERLK